jgi:hypothetical protein
MFRNVGIFKYRRLGVTQKKAYDIINPLVPSDPHMGRTAQLTSRRCILNIYSTNIRTEYFKRAA